MSQPAFSPPGDPATVIGEPGAWAPGPWPRCPLHPCTAGVLCPICTLGTPGELTPCPGPAPSDPGPIGLGMARSSRFSKAAQGPRAGVRMPGRGCPVQPAVSPGLSGATLYGLRAGWEGAERSVFASRVPSVGGESRQEEASSCRLWRLPRAQIWLNHLCEKMQILGAPHPSPLQTHICVFLKVSATSRVPWAWDLGCRTGQESGYMGSPEPHGDVGGSPRSQSAPACSSPLRRQMTPTLHWVGRGSGGTRCGPQSAAPGRPDNGAPNPCT